MGNRVLLRRLTPYGVSLLAVGVATALTLALWKFIRPLPFPFYFLAVIVAALSGGVWPGLLTVLLSVVAANFFIFVPRVDWATGQSTLLQETTFVLVATVICVLVESQRRSHAAGREQQRWFQGTLASIGDAVIATDTEGRVTFMNSVAQRLTGWSLKDARSRPLDEVFKIANEQTWEAVPNPVSRVLETGLVVGLANHTVLFRRDGDPIPIDDSAAPIKRDERDDGETAGVVLVFRDITERKKAADREQEANQRTTTILESITDAFMALDRQWCFTYVNPAAERIVGQGREALIGENHWEQYPATVGTHLEHEYRRAVAERTPVAFEYCYAPWERWFGISAYPTRDGGLSVYFRDITEQKIAEEQTARLAAIVTSSEDAIIAKTLDGIILDWNPAAERMYGYTLEEVRGRSITLLVPPDLMDDFAEILQRLKRGEAITHYETERVAKDGSRLHVSLSVSPLRNSAGELIGASTIARDVTQRRRIEQALRESEERLRLALDAGEIGVWDWDIPKNKVRWSERLYEFHGLVPGTFGGTIEAFAALVHPEDRERVAKAIRHAIEEAASYAVEFRALRPDGEERVLSARARVLREEDGQPLLMIGATLDITERQALEDELREQARELAERDRQKDEFLAMLAHELRNPLSPIVTAVEILRLRGPTEPLLTRQRDIIERQARHLTRMVDDLLDVSRVTRGKIQLRHDWLDLAQVVYQAVQACGPQIEARQHDLTVNLPREPLYVAGDSDRLSQVVVNLLNNAAKYTPPKGEIVVSVRNEGNVALVAVRDTGDGIAPETLPHIFDLFLQADRSLDRSQGGLGIGLTMVKRLVEAHGGSVEARSDGLGKGSEFVVRLPVAPELAAERPGELPARPTLLLKRRVLVVEDNLDAAETLQDLLSAAGHAVRVTHSGPEALEALVTDEPDLVLLDIGLPGMDGYEVAKEIRRRAPSRTPVLVAVTGYGREEDRARARAAGIDYHLVKPLDFHALEQILTTPLRDPWRSA